MGFWESSRDIIIPVFAGIGGILLGYFSHVLISRYDKKQEKIREVRNLLGSLKDIYNELEHAEFKLSDLDQPLMDDFLSVPAFASVLLDINQPLLSSMMVKYGDSIEKVKGLDLVVYSQVSWHRSKLNQMLNDFLFPLIDDHRKKPNKSPELIRNMLSQTLNDLEESMECLRGYIHPKEYATYSIAFSDRKSRIAKEEPLEVPQILLNIIQPYLEQFLGKPVSADEGKDLIRRFITNPVLILIMRKLIGQGAFKKLKIGSAQEGVIFFGQLFGMGKDVTTLDITKALKMPDSVLEANPFEDITEAEEVVFINNKDLYLFLMLGSARNGQPIPFSVLKEFVKANRGEISFLKMIGLKPVE